MFLCPVRTVTASGALIEKMEKKSYRRLTACKICFVLRAKSVTQGPRESYRDRDVLYGELNYYSGCPPPKCYL